MAHPVIRALMGLIGVISLFGISLFTLMPAWAVEILGGDAATLGWLQSARGAGALIGALLLASLGRFNFKGKLLTCGMFGFPLMLLIFALVRWLPLSLFVLVAAGSMQILALNLANAIVQTQVTDELRGRVMGIYSLVFFGLMPVGSLLAGAAAQTIGEPETVIAGALIALGVAALVWVFLPSVRALE